MSLENWQSALTCHQCKPSDIEISNLAQGLWKDETDNWDEDELLELVVAQFGDRVLPDEWNGVTEVKPPDGDADRRELVRAEQ